MASTVYGLTVQQLESRELAYLQGVNETILAEALEAAASQFNLALAKWVDPASITEAAFPDDYGWCRTTVGNGAAGFYGLYSTGAYEGFERFITTFNGAMESLGHAPSFLVSYRAGKEATAARAGAITSHVNDLTDEELGQVRMGMLDPGNRDQWETV